MKKFFEKYGSMIAALALAVTTISANSACTWITYQPELPEVVKKLRKF